ncbi:MAG: aminopeptidase P family protein [Clostridiales Family XIII bacterium]|jgi:Xaa-Pro aminopeptidase|nr:aminopeptidase P family protein [Clostridiales Family XIII bacterium]
MIKSAEALLSIAKAQALGDACFSYILTRIKPGVSEKAIAAEIENFLFDGGAEALAFPTICVSGENSAKPHGEPSDKLIKNGDFLTMDFGAVVDGYCGDMTRTVAVGRVSGKQRKVYNIVLEAQETALAAVKDGVPCSHIDKIARDIITNAGFGAFYTHSTGHGVGRQVHEDPRIGAESETVLAENMPVTVEPGIYIPGEFGVRIEDLAIVTKFGIINLTHSEKRMIVIN